MAGVWECRNSSVRTQHVIAHREAALPGGQQARDVEAASHIEQLDGVPVGVALQLPQLLAAQRVSRLGQQPAPSI